MHSVGYDRRGWSSRSHGSYSNRVLASRSKSFESSIVFSSDALIASIASFQGENP